MTLDQAQEAFKTNPIRDTAAELLGTGLTYWHDDMIGDETFDYEVVKPVLDWLRTAS